MNERDAEICIELCSTFLKEVLFLTRGFFTTVSKEKKSRTAAICKQMIELYKRRNYEPKLNPEPDINNIILLMENYGMMLNVYSSIVFYSFVLV